VRARIALPVVAALLLAASPAWRWTLPPGREPPTVPADNPMSAAKVALGRRLFYEADLSVDGTMSCAACHEQKRGFADDNRTRPGVHGDPGRRNVPGLANVAWLPSLTWGDPRIRTLEAQVAVPITGLHPVEMGMAGREAEIAVRLRRDACYRRMFRAAFPGTRGRIDFPAITKALAAFERTLVAEPQSRPASATFTRDCASCHSGPLLTDGRFHRVVPPTAEDRGLVETTGRSSDEGAFRTPSLVNVAITGPWLHDGRADTLAAAIRAHGLSLSDAEVASLLADLNGLTERAFLSDPRFGYPEDVCRGSASSSAASRANAAVSSAAPFIAASSAR
jgi:cytochrome c peroxidase